MANEQQLNFLKQGVETWNDWRKENRDVNVDLGWANLFEANLNGVDLIGVDLSRANLSRADLSRAYLYDANLNGAVLSRADLSRADLNGADLNGAYLRRAYLSETVLNGAKLSLANLSGADLHRAKLSGADLRGVDLSGADLRGADLREADLRGADLSGADLSGVDLRNTIAQRTKFTDVDLSKAMELDQMHHTGPSSIGLDTIRLSRGKLPVEFLRGCGLSDYEIKAVKLHDPDLSASQYNDLLYELSALRNSDAINFHSCFISYSSQNESLAKKLYTDLQESGARCWYAPEDLKIGEKISTGIDRAISMHQKLLLIISKDSIESNWVEREVERAIRREGTEKIDMIFPIRLDDDIMQIEEGWAAYVRNLRHIGDFREWQNEASYKKAFERLKQDLQQNVEHDNGE